MEGIVESHYLRCPYCGGRADLVDHRCLGCGALATKVVWEATSPELAMISTRKIYVRY